MWSCNQLLKCHNCRWLLQCCFFTYFLGFIRFGCDISDPISRIFSVIDWISHSNEHWRAVDPHKAWSYAPVAKPQWLDQLVSSKELLAATDGSYRRSPSVMTSKKQQTQLKAFSHRRARLLFPRLALVRVWRRAPLVLLLSPTVDLISWSQPRIDSWFV